MIKIYKPYTQSRRFITTEDFSNLTKKEPQKTLLLPLIKKSGRNNTGRIMVRHRGGGHKRLYRLIDFKRNKYNIPAKVVSIEYDPNRSARIALLHYIDGEKRYILAPEGLKIGETVVSGENVEIKVGNALPLKNIPAGMFIHNIELIPFKGGQLVRSAGSQAQLMGKAGKYAQIKLPSGEIRLIPIQCYATIGQVGNIEHNTITYGNAGRMRHLGIRPTVRGTKMNAVDHPHGGGRGKSKGGNQPQSPWGQPAKGFKTRNKKKPHHWKIIQDRRIKITVQT